MRWLEAQRYRRLETSGTLFSVPLPSWRLSCEHLARTVRDSGRTTWNPERSFGLETRWLEAQLYRRLETSGKLSESRRFQI
jgi:hypothetical protein